METPSVISSDRIKHLEFIQSTISRLSGHSFLIKGWALTLAGALFAFSTKESSWAVASIALIPLASFWALDAHFLRQERDFRDLYDDVRDPDGSVELFSMKTPARRSSPWVRAALSVSLGTFYGGLTIANLAILGALAATR